MKLTLGGGEREIKLSDVNEFFSFHWFLKKMEEKWMFNNKKIAFLAFSSETKY